MDKVSKWIPKAKNQAEILHYSPSIKKDETVNMHHDKLGTIPYLKEYYDNSDFFNYGFWREDTRKAKEASENLMEELLAFIPQRTGNILDVSCGKGATTRYLLKYYNPEKVFGINVSKKQLQELGIRLSQIADKKIVDGQ